MRNLSIFVAVLIATAGCHKKKQDLPEATHSGKNMLACHINGENFIYAGKQGLLSIEWAYYLGPYFSFGVDSGFSIIGRSDVSPGTEVRLYVQPFSMKDTTYSLGGYSSSYAGYYPWESDGQHYRGTDSLHNGFITVIYTPADGILSGTFEFDGFDKQTGEEIHVTDGRFDIGHY